MLPGGDRPAWLLIVEPPFLFLKPLPQAFGGFFGQGGGNGGKMAGLGLAFAALDVGARAARAEGAFEGAAQAFDAFRHAAQNRNRRRAGRARSAAHRRAAG